MKRNVARVRNAGRLLAVDHSLGELAGEGSFQPIAEPGHPLAIRGVGRASSRSAKGGGQRHILRPGATASLLRPAEEVGRQRQAAADPERTDPLRRVDLVAGDGQEIDSQPLDVEVDLPERLHRIGVNDHTALAAGVRDLLNRLQHARLVVGEHYGHEPRVGPESIDDCRGVDAPRPVAWDDGDRVPPIFQIVHRLADGGVFNGGGHDMSMGRESNGAEDRRVVRLCAAAGEDHITRRSPDQRGDRLARVLQHAPRQLALPMNAGGVTKDLAKRIIEDLQHGWINPRRGVVIHVNPHAESPRDRRTRTLTMRKTLLPGFFLCAIFALNSPAQTNNPPVPSPGPAVQATTPANPQQQTAQIPPAAPADPPTAQSPPATPGAAQPAQNPPSPAAGAPQQTPAPQPAAAAEPKKDPAADPGVRKLSRRERKDKIKNLSDKYRQFLEDVEPIMLPTELDTFLVLETDAQREIYIVEFWRRRDVASHTTNHAYKDLYYERLEDARDKYKPMSSDRARTYLIQGEPAGILEVDCSRYLQPIQIWEYAYIPGLGHEVRLLFYQPRYSNKSGWKLWNPMGVGAQALEELVSQEAIGARGSEQAAVQWVFYESEFSCPGCPYQSKVASECKYGDEINRAIFTMQQARVDLPKIFDPPQVNEEDVHKILRSVVLATPNAPKLNVELKVEYPTRDGGRTDAEMIVLIDKSQLKINEVGGTKTYNLDVTGEVLKEEKLFENYRYRYDFPADTKQARLAVVIDRLLRPADYKARIKVTDVNSGAEAIIEKDLQVPEILDSAEKVQQVQAGAAAVAKLKTEADSGTKLRIIPLPDDLLSGLQHIQTIATGDNIKAVEFYLDGRKVMVKRQPPYDLELDFGNVPQVRRIRAVALDASGQILTGDDAVVNTGNDPFRVRIDSPRVAAHLRGKIRVHVSTSVPDGKILDHVDLFLNETRIVTMYDTPFVQVVDVPETLGVGYLRAVATLKDDPVPPVEDVVMVNTPEFMQEVDVHLVELPTTVVSGGKTLNSLPESAFKVLDEGRPVKITKFEYVKNLPLSIGLAIDTSGSMQPRMAEAQKAGAEFFQKVLKPGDKAFVVSFDTQPQMVQKWSPRLSDLNAGLSKLRAEEATALYDAIVYSLYNFLGVRGQRALVVITDGKDNSSKFSFDQAIEYARRAAIPIYGIGIGIKQMEVDVRYKFGKFCSETGGNVYYIDQASDLRRIYDDIQNELRSQYLLGFYPPTDVKTGSEWLEVTVQVSEGKAKTIRGYYP
jgi:Ca-activated chloride channel family protein